MATGKRFRDLDEVRAANKRIGQTWFGPAERRFFGTRVHEELYGGRYFVTSERDSMGHAWDGERRYTVRAANADGTIRTVSEFGEYASRSGAHAAARRLAEQA